MNNYYYVDLKLPQFLTISLVSQGIDIDQVILHAYSQQLGTKANFATSVATAACF
jgi:hypothetical protein